MSSEEKTQKILITIYSYVIMMVFLMISWLMMLFGLLGHMKIIFMLAWIPVIIGVLIVGLIFILTYGRK